MNRFLCAFLAFSLMTVLSACGTAVNFSSTTSGAASSQSKAEPPATSVPTASVESGIINITLTVGSDSFSAQLYDSATTRALTQRFPLTLAMGDLHGNEKYNYLTEELPANPETLGQINTGDILLYGSDCLVLFYDSFTSSFSYTRLGSIHDAARFAAAVGSGDVSVTFKIV